MTHQSVDESQFDCFVFSPPGCDPLPLLRSAQKAGALGVWTYGADVPDVASAGIRRMGIFAQDADAIDAAVALLDIPLVTLIAPLAAIDAARASVADARTRGIDVLAELTGWSQTANDMAVLLDGFVLKGHECGGLVSEQTTFILLQDISRKTTMPLYARGGISPETAAAAKVAGARGVVLADEVMLFVAAGLQDKALCKRIAGFSGNDGVQIEDPRGGHYLRGYATFGRDGVAALTEKMRAAPQTAAVLSAQMSWQAGAIAPGGQGLALAEPMRRRYGTLGRFVTAIGKAIATLPAQAAARRALDRGGPLAVATGTDYPVWQGPMTRVSDVSDFFLRVAEGGGLPFAALALMRGPQAETLLQETKALMGDRPWGVGLLGFADKDILDPQFEAVEKVRPDFAIVAGGRAHQVAWLADKGIRGYVHVATPSIVSAFLDDGVTRFIVEGRECGGHIGPLSSFVLWSVITDAIASHPKTARAPAKVEVIFAGGIHDALSAAMVATIAEPLAAMGVKIGVLMGTAYLYTHEIVESGAILPDYQEVALACDGTQSLWEGPGFASRCAVTPITQEFRARKIALEEKGASVPEVRKALETYTLGRLRMATKGVARVGPDKTMTEISQDQRRAEGMYMIGQVAAMQESVRSIADLHTDVCTGSVALLQKAAQGKTTTRAKAPEPCDIAIVGMSTLLPGADTLQAYWRRILSGESAIREVPADRWSKIAYFDKDKTVRDKIYATRGGFLDDVAFNPLDYGIPPKAIPSIDPMQLLALEVVADALKDASCGADEAFDRERMSVVFGFSGGLGEAGSQYAVRAELQRLMGEVPEEILTKLPEWTEDSFAGLLPNVTSGRVANRFDLGGLNQTVDAACASSLAAVYSAVLELESGRSDTVIAGGVDTLQSPFGYLCFAKTTALSPRGVCNTFDVDADGIVISEGLAAIVMKRLSDAERDGDRIYAVIKGVGSSSDGSVRGLTAPVPAGQKRAFRRAYAQAGFAPGAVQLFEAHGTGTVAGDRAELETVTEVLRGTETNDKSIAIGSVKTLIGHTKATAGLAGLIKVAMGLHYKVLPPHALVKTPNPVFAADDTPLFLSQKPRPWVTPTGTPRRAGVSAFGFGGTNFHVALEEHAEPAVTDGHVELGFDLALFAFAAADRPALAARVTKFQGAIVQGACPTLVRAAQKAAADVGSGDYRLAFTATSLAGLQDQLAAAMQFLSDPAVPAPQGMSFTQDPVLLRGGKLAFLFPGQGSQYPDMQRMTALLGPQMLDALGCADRLFANTPTGVRLARDLSHFIYPGEAFDPAAQKRNMAALTATEVAQPALGVVEAGMTALLADLGVCPDMVAGHSYGEFTALHAAGAFGFDDLIRLSEARGRAIIDNGDPEKPGAMLALAADGDTTRAALAGVKDVVIANLNSPRQTVVAGATQAIDAAVPVIEAAGLQALRVPVSQAFHSPLMDGAMTQFKQALSQVNWATPQCPVYANGTAKPHKTTAAALQKAMAQHLVSPVDFVAMVRNMAADGASVFVEVGPKSVLSNRLSEILLDNPPLVIPLDRSSGDAAAFFAGLGQLFVAGAAIDLASLAARMADPQPRAKPAGDAIKNTWFLNGAYARRADAPLRDVSPPQQPVAAPTVPCQHAPLPVAGPPTEEELIFMEMKPEALYPAAPACAGQCAPLAQYYQMMTEFLRVQENVMLAYLGQSGGAQTPVAMPLLAPVPGLAAVMPTSPLAPVAPPAPLVPVQPAATTPAPIVQAPVAAPAPAASAAMDSDAVIDLFLNTVADKTGYPVDTLDADQAMEADLGVDSIKRMEILGAVQKALPSDLSQTLRDEMGNIAQLPSIREIVTHVFDHASDAVPAPVAEVARPFDQTGEAKTVAQATLPRYVQNPFEEAADHVPSDLPANIRVIVTEAADGFHDDVMAVLAAQDIGHVCLPDAILQSDDLDALADWVAGQNPAAQPLGVIFCAARAAMPAAALTDFSAWQSAHDSGTKSLFRLLKVTAPYLQNGGRLVVTMATGGLFGRTAHGAAYGLSCAPGALGLVKALSLEWSGGSLKVVDLDPTLPVADQAGQVVCELRFTSGRREVGYPSGRRTILRTEPAALAPPSLPPVLPDPSWVIVATGGARGITAECLRTLAPFKPTLVLIGRSAQPTPEDPALRDLDQARLRAHFVAAAKASGTKFRPVDIEAQLHRYLGQRDMLRNLADLAALGARVDYRAADVSDPAAVAELFAGIFDRYGHVDMVVHGAGIIQDAPFEKKTTASFNNVFDTKVDSAFLVTQAAMNDRLRAVCFFTSVAGRYGNPGQADYAAANETLCRYAWALQRGPLAHGQVKAINWGPWGKTTTGAGMVTETVRQQFLSRGIGMVEAVPGRNYFFQEMFWTGSDDVESNGWVADGETLEAATCALPPVPGEMRPDASTVVLLKDAVVAADNLAALRWRFDIVSAPYTDDHRFDAIAVMPMAGVIQILSEVPAALNVPGRVVSVENLKMFKGLTLEDGPKDLRLEMTSVPQAPSKVHVRILSDDSKPRVHYQADLTLADSYTEVGIAPSPTSSNIGWAGPQMPAIYRHWLSHGPRFQTLDWLNTLNAQQMRFVAHGSRPESFVPVPASAEWHFDPALLDGMVQTLWVWSKALHDMSALPLSAQSIRRFAGDPALGPLQVETEILGVSEGQEVLSRIRAFDAQGRLCYEVEGFRVQCTKMLNRLGGGWPGGERIYGDDRLDAAR